MPAVSGMRAGNNGNQGAQVRGFGFLHDGSVDTTFRFHRANVFSNTVTDAQNLEQFMLQFDSNLAPIVGQQVTLTSTNSTVAGPRIDLLIARAAANECDVVVKGTISGLQRGAVRLASGQFRTDRASEALLSDTQVRALATAGQELTYTCVPPGSGTRIGVDRDEDGFLDRTEIDAGSDPADPSSIPGGPTTTTTTTTTTTGPGSTSTTSTTTPTGGLVQIQTKSLKLKDDLVAKKSFAFKSGNKLDPPANHIMPPLPGSLGDPTFAGGAVTFYNSAGLTLDQDTYALAAAGWEPLGSATSPKGWKYNGKLVGDTVVKSVTVKADSISVKGTGTYTLNEPAQGRIATRLTLGSATWCADAPAKTGTPPPSGKNDVAGKFTAQSKTPPPAVCPPTH
jgi:hypothetical protein